MYFRSSKSPSAVRASPRNSPLATPPTTPAPMRLKKLTRGTYSSVTPRTIANESLKASTVDGSHDRQNRSAATTSTVTGLITWSIPARHSQNFHRSPKSDISPRGLLGQPEVPVRATLFEWQVGQIGSLWLAQG